MVAFYAVTRVPSETKRETNGALPCPEYGGVTLCVGQFHPIELIACYRVLVDAN